ncbi:CBS domain-containing protein CBSX6-like [Zingiber officinale]|uniref:CBS domain-containing protein CBSX6-like n=1 Tax=Zingiber officinale TaxID=94328 RepID=UPI001C4BCD32|nr:CBS domain-containing protein CBSX6-like [Zingiber officinale]
MAHVFLHHVVGDLTLGKPELVQFYDSEPVEAAVRAIGDSAEGAITVWRSPSPDSAAVPRPPPSADRFVGMLNSLDVVLFLARARVHDQEKSMRTPVSELITPNHDLLKEVDPATRLIDALDMMKQGVRRLLVRKSVMWRGFSKRFSVLYNGKWLKNSQSSSVGGASNSDRPSSSVLHENKYCCLSREDIVRFLIGCLGALAPLPLSSISSLGAINSNYSFIEAFSPTLEAIQKIPHNPCAIAVVETNSDGTHKIIGDISAYKLWKCDYWAAAWAMRNLSAGQFVLGADDYGTALDSVPDFSIDSPPENTVAGASLRRQKFSSRSMGFSSSQVNQMPLGRLRNMYRGRSAPLTCKPTSSLAAVMAQMLSYRATHVWVIDAATEDDTVVGIVTFTEILIAVTHYPAS